MTDKQQNLNSRNLPACAVDFIRLIIKKMRYRKKVRVEVMAELGAHFEDALRDCKGDEERDRRAKELIAGFGDVKLLGVLLRRAKKRCRPLWRSVVARACQTVAVLIVCFVIYVAWFLTGKPVVTTDYLAQFNRMFRPAADESLNAAPFYEKAAELYEKRWDDLANLRSNSPDRLKPEQLEKLKSDINVLSGKRYDKVTDEQKERLSKWVDENKEILDLVIAGSKKPYYWHHYATKQGTTELIAVLLPDLSQFKSLARLLQWRARLSAEEGGYEDAFRDIEACYRMGSHLKATKPLIEQLVGMAVKALATHTLRDVLGRYEIDAPTLAALQTNLEQIVAAEEFTVSFDGEKLILYDEIQRCFTEDRLGGGHLYPPRVMQLGNIWDSMDSAQVDSMRWHDIVIDIISSPDTWPLAAKALFAHPNKHETIEMADRYYDFWTKMTHKTPARIRAESMDPRGQGMQIVKGNILLDVLTPAVGRVNELSHRCKTEVQATLTILGLLRHRKDKGFCPETLEELINVGYLKELPIDLYSDKALVYKKTDNDFVLYSVGENFTDDGGQVLGDPTGRRKVWSDKGDAVFWPGQK
ncbi:MAG: hypothetical protein ACYTBJ_21045 [Planctomycetota bacterium]|jgi:hypothetical protein